MFNSIPYILFFAVLLALGFFENKFAKCKSRVLILSFLLFILFLGLREKIGWDWRAYNGLFNLLSDSFAYDAVSSFALQQKKEIGFLYYSIVIKSIYDNFNFYIFASTLIDAIILFTFLRKYCVNIAWGVAAFIVMSLVTEVDLMRNIKAILLFLIALKYIVDRKLLKYSLVILLATSFHSSSIIFFPLYFILYREYSKKIILLLFIIGNIIFFFRLSIGGIIIESISLALGSKYALLYEAYSTNDFYMEARGLSIGFVERTCSFVLIYLFSDKILLQNKRNLIFVNSFYLYIFPHLFFYDFLIVLERAGIIFAYSYWILYPLLEKIIVRENNRIIFCFVVVIYSMLKIILVTGNEYYKYSNMLF